jgi:hypothetical protein
MMLNSKRFGDRHFDSVVSLLHFDGANASTTFRDDGRKTWVTNGNAQISTAQGPFGSSGLFDGTDDFLSILENSGYQVATGSFTVEAWIRPSNVSSVRVVAGQRTGGPNAGWSFSIQASGVISFTHWNTVGNVWGSVVGGTALSINTAYHVAADFDGTTLRVYVNGAVDGSSTSFTGTRVNAAVVVYIGRDHTTTARDFAGYMAEFRFTKGVARYAGAYTPATRPFPDGTDDPHWSNVSGLLHFYGANASTTFWDERGRLWTPSGNAQLSTTSQRFGTASGLFDGNGDYITADDDNDFNFAAGDFTIDAWVRPAAWWPDETYFPAILAQRTNVTSNFAFSFEFNGLGTALNFYASSTGASVTFTLTAAHTFALDTWAHVAVSRSGSTWRLFINGTLVDTETSSFTIFNSTAVVRSAAYDVPVFAKSYFNGRIDDLRVTKGICRYNGSFQIPVQAFPNYKTIP